MKKWNWHGHRIAVNGASCKILPKGERILLRSNMKGEKGSSNSAFKEKENADPRDW